MQIDMDIVRSFFTLVFDFDFGAHDALLWFRHPTTDKKVSVFIQSIDAACAAVIAHAEWHCYWGVGLRPHQAHTNPHWRGKSADVTGLLCGWLDLDTAHAQAHSAPRLPPTIDDAKQLLLEYPDVLQPTILVHSGFGLQPEWLLKEPDWFNEAEDGPADRQAASAAVHRLWAVASQAAERHGWTIDPLYDLARVLRIPGTVNWKVPDEPRLATFEVWKSGVRYPSMGDILSNCPEVKAVRKGKLAIPDDIREECSHVLVTTGPPSERVTRMVDALIENSNKFKKTWRKERKDLKGDYTQSEWDFSVAMQLAHGGATATDISDVLNYYRGKYEKTTKVAYLRWTIEHALTAVRQQRSETYMLTEVAQENRDARKKEQEEKESEDTEAETEYTYEKDSQGTQDLYNAIARFWEIEADWEITHIQFFHADPPFYRYVLIEKKTHEKKEFALSQEACLSLGRLRTAVHGVTGLGFLKNGNKAQTMWLALQNRIMRVLPLAEVVDDLSLKRQVAEAMEDYLGVSNIVDMDEPRDDTEDTLYVLQRKMPFTQTGKLYVNFNHFTEWLATHQVFGALTRPTLFEGLRALDGVPMPQAIKWHHDGSRAQARYWEFPAHGFTHILVEKRKYTAR